MRAATATTILNSSNSRTTGPLLCKWAIIIFVMAGVWQVLAERRRRYGMAWRAACTERTRRTGSYPGFRGAGDRRMDGVLGAYVAHRMTVRALVGRRR